MKEEVSGDTENMRKQIEMLEIKISNQIKTSVQILP
jgi:hypothetical protein